MITLRQSANYAWMSQASYLNLAGLPIGVSGPVFAARLVVNELNDDKVFAQDQAAELSNSVSGFSLIQQFPNTNNGTSLTIFKSNDSINPIYTIAVRGTEATAQLSSDLLQDFFGVVLAGKAKTQLIEAFRIYKKATTPGGQPVSYSGEEVSKLVGVILSGLGAAGSIEKVAATISLVSALVSDDLGQGDVGQTEIPSGATINFTGHSLGGHVAYLLAELVQSTITGNRVVGDVVTFNAPGVDALTYEVANWLGINTTVQSGVIGNSHVAIYGFGGISVTAGLGQISGTRRPVFIESAGWLTTENHSIVKLADSLALQKLFYDVDARVNSHVINVVQSAISRRMADSNERALEALYRLITGTEIQVPVEDRSSYYIRVAELEAALAVDWPNQNLELKSLVELTAGQVVSAAVSESGLAYRYALLSLLPFAVTGSDALYAQFNQNGELYLDDALSGTAESISGRYLGDRAALLEVKNRVFTLDGEYSVVADGSDVVKYVDKVLKNESGEDLTFTSIGRRIAGPLNIVFVVFGGNEGDFIRSDDSTSEDHFYGGRGVDTLVGLAGRDYLEGKSGDDTLFGGLDDDLLVGGYGFDTYVYTDGDGFDTIIDADGSGQILYNGAALTGGTKVGEGVFRDSAGAEYLFFDLEDGNGFLLIDGNILVEDFVPGALGLDLDDARPVPARPTSTALNTYQGEDLPTGFDSSDLEELIRNVHGSMGDDRFIVGDQMSAVVGRSGNDVAVLDANVYGFNIDMGSGDDLIDATASDGSVQAARLVGGSGSDFILGGAGNDLIWGDNYLAIHRTSARSDYFRVDGFVYNAGPQMGPGATAGLPTGYGAFIAPFLYPSSWAEYASLDLDALTSDGTVYAGSLQGALEDVLGVASSFDDYIDADDGDDFVVGGSGSDEIYGGSGDDSLWGDSVHGFSGSPNPISLEQDFGTLAALFGLSGDDTIDGGPGNDTISDQDGGNDILIGGEGNDTISSIDFLRGTSLGIGARNVILGGAGDDIIEVSNRTGGSDVVDGGDGDDQISVTAIRYVLEDPQGGDNVTYGPVPGRAIVTGGAGNDILTVYADDGVVDGGSGDDEYTVSGASIIISDPSGEDTLYAPIFSDISQFDAYMESFVGDLGFGDQRGSVFVTRDGADMLLALNIEVEGEPADSNRILIRDWFAGPGHQIEHIVTSDGSAFTSAQFETWGGIHAGGSRADEFLEYSDHTDRVFGGAGDDLIFTGEGDDRIYGGPGDDELYGGAGDDTYYYAGGDGNDIVSDSSGFDELRFGPGITSADVTASQGESGIVLTIGTGSIGILGASRADPGMDRLSFFDGSTVLVADLLPAPDLQPVIGETAGVVTPGGEPTPGAETAVDGEPGVVPALPMAAATTSAIEPLVQGDDLPTLVRNPAGALGRDDAASFAGPASGSASDTAQEQRASRGAPLNLQTLLDALDAFDAPATIDTDVSVSGHSSATGSGAQRAEPTGTALTSIALTNALLQFHLQKSDGSGAPDGAAEWYPTSDTFSGAGIATTQSFGLPSFSRQTGGLPTFAGLQEGFARLA